MLRMLRCWLRYRRVAEDFDIKRHERVDTFAELITKLRTDSELIFHDPSTDEPPWRPLGHHNGDYTAGLSHGTDIRRIDS